MTRLLRLSGVVRKDIQFLMEGKRAMNTKSDSSMELRLNQIAERLSGVVGKPWIYEPEHQMFIGTTNALNIYYDVIDLGRDNKEWIPYQDEHSKGYRLTDASVKQIAGIKALGHFLEACREDMQFLMDLCSSQSHAMNPNVEQDGMDESHL